MKTEDQEEMLLRSVALQNANSILLARQRAEQELLEAKAALELRTEELAHSLAMVRATLESTTDGILVTDGAGRVTGFNEKFIAMWKIPPEVMESREHRRLLEMSSMKFRDPSVLLARVEEIYKSSPPETYDLLELIDGRVIERFSRIQFVGQRNVGRVWGFRDITERKRLEEAPFRLAAIVESSNDAIVSKTLEGIVISWNKRAEQMFGYAAEEIVGRPIIMLIPPERAEEEPKFLDKLARGERIEHYETVRIRKDGTRFDVALTVSPIHDAHGRIIGASKIARDITEQKLAAREREELLEAERAARAEANRVNMMKDEFFANVSHELRTPLNAILGWAQLLASRPSSAEDLKEGLETIERNARAQVQLIEDLLDMSRIASGKVRLDVQETNLVTVVEGAVTSVRPAAETKGIQIKTILDPRLGPVSGDPNRLQQVVWNLLSNAVKFTPKGGRVEVRLQRANSHLEVIVSDTGKGIRQEFLPYVFERFRQADSATTRKYGGLGLGLSIVKQLVELHGGSVDVNSAGEGHGATFIVRLPPAPVFSSAPREHPLTPSRPTVECGDIDLTGVRILVIDDEADARFLIQRVLKEYAAEVCIASNAAEALELVKTQRPNVLVSDIGMPVIDGYQFIREVRRLPTEQGGNTSAVALTAFARSEDRMKAMIAGFQAHVSKPIEAQELVVTIASLVGRMTRRPD